MTIHHQAEQAITTLTRAFAPLQCQITAPSRKGGFSFTIVSEYGVACHSQRIYPEQYSNSSQLQQVIDRAQRALLAA